MENQWTKRDLVNAGWMHPEEAENLQLVAFRLKKKLYVVTHCPECDRELPPRRCEHCNGAYPEERSE